MERLFFADANLFLTQIQDERLSQITAKEQLLLKCFRNKLCQSQRDLLVIPPHVVE